MRKWMFGVLYMAAVAVANGAWADNAALEALRQGSLKKLVFASPKPVAATPFTDNQGGSHTLADWQGKYLLVNFWATWCAPCRSEMEALDDLETTFGGDDFQVVTIATGRNPLPAIQAFFADNQIDNLPILLDPKLDLARQMGVLGLPVSVLVDPDGNEIARLIGDAEWNSDSARAIIAKLVGGGGS